MDIDPEETFKQINEIDFSRTPERFLQLDERESKSSKKEEISSFEESRTWSMVIPNCRVEKLFIDENGLIFLYGFDEHENGCVLCLCFPSVMEAEFLIHKSIKGFENGIGFITEVLDFRSSFNKEQILVLIVAQQRLLLLNYSKLRSGKYEVTSVTNIFPGENFSKKELSGLIITNKGRLAILKNKRLHIIDTNNSLANYIAEITLPAKADSRIFRTTQSSNGMVLLVSEYVSHDGTVIAEVFSKRFPDGKCEDEFGHISWYFRKIVLYTPRKIQSFVTEVEFVAKDEENEVLFYKGLKSHFYNKNFKFISLSINNRDRYATSGVAIVGIVSNVLLDTMISFVSFTIRED